MLSAAVHTAMMIAQAVTEEVLPKKNQRTSFSTPKSRGHGTGSAFDISLLSPQSDMHTALGDSVVFKLELC